MRKSTSINFKAVLIALFVVSLGIEMVSAAGFPSVKELYGRYKFICKMKGTGSCGTSFSSFYFSFSKVLEKGNIKWLAGVIMSCFLYITKEV